MSKTKLSLTEIIFIVLVTITLIVFIVSISNDNGFNSKNIVHNEIPAPIYVNAEFTECLLSMYCTDNLTNNFIAFFRQNCTDYFTLDIFYGQDYRTRKGLNGYDIKQEVSIKFNKTELLNIYRAISNLNQTMNICDWKIETNLHIYHGTKEEAEVFGKEAKIYIPEMDINQDYFNNMPYEDIQELFTNKINNSIIIQALKQMIPYIGTQGQNFNEAIDRARRVLN
jgi:hypothetical protein